MTSPTAVKHARREVIDINQWSGSFDNAIRPQQQRRWNGDAESTGGLDVYRQLKLCWLLDGHVAGLGSFEDFIDLDGGSTPCFDDAIAIVHQSAVFGKS